MGLRIWQKIALAFLIGATAVAVSVGGVYYRIAKIQIEKEILNKFKAVVQLKTYFLEEFFGGNVEHIEDLQISLGCKYRLPTLEKHKNDKSNPEYIKAKEFLETRCNQYTDIHEEFNHLMLVDTTGEIVFVSTSQEQGHLGKLLNEVTPAEESVFDKAKNEIYRTDILYHPDHGDYAMTLAGPLFLDEKFIGEIVLEINIDAISKIMQDRTGLGETGETYLIGRDFLMRSQSRFVKESTILKTKVDTEGTRKWHKEHIADDLPADMSEDVDAYRDSQVGHLSRSGDTVENEQCAVTDAREQTRYPSCRMLDSR